MGFFYEKHHYLVEYPVVWDSPSADARGSMPLGNGDLSLNAWVEGGTFRQGLRLRGGGD